MFPADATPALPAGRVSSPPPSFTGVAGPPFGAKGDGTPPRSRSRSGGDAPVAPPSARAVGSGALAPPLASEHGNPAPWGANCQRQAGPPLRGNAPYAGTGMENRLPRDSGVCIVAKREGIVESVDATRIVVRSAGEKAEIPDIYPLTKFQRSNQSTCFNQTPIARAG